MPTISSQCNALSFRLLVGCIFTIALIQQSQSEEQKKPPAPAAPAHGAAPVHSAAPAQQHTVGAPGGAGQASHGPSTNSPHGPTTNSPHGPTTSGQEPRVTKGGGGNDVRPPGKGGAETGGGAGRENRGRSSFAGHPAPAGSHDVHAANGAAIRTRADGSRSDVHDPKRGMDIHHGLDGNRRVAVERPDHSRVVADRGGRGYVQHPYMYHGHEIGHRTYYEHGRAYDRFYGRYPYGGSHLDVYYPGQYYPYGFYGYAYAPWPAPVPYAWAPAPWYGAYGYYYAPYPVYAEPAFWLTDFAIAASLAIAYEAIRAGADLENPFSSPALMEFARSVTDRLVGPADAAAAPALTPAIKQMVADETKLIVLQEGNEAQANAAKQDPDPAASSVVKLLSDNHSHVFVGGVDVDLVTAAEKECTFSQGDVLKVASAPAPGADTASAIILASKGDKECPTSSSVTVAVSDLQDMYNHLRESIDDGLKELQHKQGKDGLPAAPASAAGESVPAAAVAGAPPPDTNVGAEIAKQAKEADAAEQEATASVAAGPAESTAAGTSKTISMGQSIDAVTATLGAPTRIIDLGAKKIYTYPDMKVIFENGKVSDVQ